MLFHKIVFIPGHLIKYENFGTSSFSRPYGIFTIFFLTAAQFLSANLLCNVCLVSLVFCFLIVGLLSDLSVQL